MKKLFNLVLLTVALGIGSYACTGITKTVDGTTLYGANMDWNNPYGHIRFIPGEKDENGIALLAYGEYNYAQGVNEKGLAIDYFYTPFMDTKKGKNKAYYNGDLVIGALKNCATVDEVIEMYNNYNLDFLNTFQLLITDKNGDSVVFEGDVIHRKDGESQVVTNFILSKVKGSSMPCTRYNKAHEIISNGELSVETFRTALDSTKQEIFTGSPTLYSYIYDLNNGDIHLYSMGDFSQSVVYNIHEELEKGDHAIYYKDLLPNDRQDEFVKQYQSQKPKEKEFSLKDLKKYVGVYKYRDGSKVDVYIKDGYLYYSFLGLDYKLLPSRPRNFFLEKDDFRISFKLDNKGNPETLVYSHSVVGYHEAKRVLSIKTFFANLFS